MKDKFINYQDLMLNRVHEILLIASEYDSYILEEDGRLTEQILNEYIGMNLSYAPRLWNASTAEDAFNMLSRRSYDLVIIMLRICNLKFFILLPQISLLFPLYQVHQYDIDKLHRRSPNRLCSKGPRLQPRFHILIDAELYLLNSLTK